MANTSEIVFFNHASIAKLWSTGDDIAILTFLSKANCGSDAVLDSIFQALDIVQTKQLQGLILWQLSDKFFCVGADLPFVCQAAKTGNLEAIKLYLQKFQRASLGLRYSSVPTIAAVRGYALGGGCELAMHCSQIVSHPLSKIGLVEASIGLVPSAGGSKEMLLRATQCNDYLTYLKAFYLQLAQGLLATNASQAKTYHYLTANDVIISETDDLLITAKKALTQLRTKNYQPPSKPLITVLNKSQTDILLDGYKTSVPDHTEHDLFIAKTIAEIFTGGTFAGSSQLTETDCLALEIEAILKLVATPKTVARIEYTLQTGKHLSN